MSLFMDMKISHKLGVAAAVVLVSMTGVGATYLGLVSTLKQTHQGSARLDELSATFDSMVVDLLHATSAEKGFFVERKERTLKKFRDAVSRAAGNAGRFAERAQTAPQRELIAQVREALAAYSKAVETAFAAQTRLGVDAASGARGALSDAAPPWGQQGATAAEESPTLEQILLTMRRQEIGYAEHQDREYVDRMEAGREALLAAEGDPERVEAVERYYQTFLAVVEGTTQLRESLAEAGAVGHRLEGLLNATRGSVNEAIATGRLEAEAAVGRINRVLAIVLIVVALGVTSVLALLSLGITRSVRRLRETMSRVSAGDYLARARLGAKDELGALGDAFDRLLDERVATLAHMQEENSNLNASVMELLTAVAQMSQRDLTVKVPVAGDVTGALGDSLNLLAKETAEVLRKVTDISVKVASASNKVKLQSDAAMSMAEREKEQVVQASDELAAAAETMNEIDELAQVCSAAADRAIAITRTARDTVTSTVEGINATRNIIRETEKRIKRLGERSQEITVAVNLINSIAERTHILALNASMHAAASAPAFFGFPLKSKA